MDVVLGIANLPQILITWSVFLAAGVTFLVAGFWVKRSSFSVRQFALSCFPGNLLSSKSARLDVKVYVIGKLTDVVWGAPGAALAVALPLALLNMLGTAWPVPRPESGPAVLAAVGVTLFLANEFADYSMHYAEHKVPALWELHKVHHSADSLSPLTSKRGHPVSIALAGIVRSVFFCGPAAVAMHVAGLSLVEVVAAGALVTKGFTILTLDPLRHSPFPVGFGWLDRCFISPHMHQIHHSSLPPHLDKNFGTNLSLFDWIFRTGHKPVRGEAIRLGLYGYSPVELDRYQTLFGTYVVPLTKAWSRVSPARRSVAAVGPRPDEDLPRSTPPADDPAQFPGSVASFDRCQERQAQS